MMAARVQVGDLGVAPGVREVGWWPQGGGRSKASGNSTSRFTIDLPQVYHDKRVTSSGIMVRGRHVREGPAQIVCRVDRCMRPSLGIRWVPSSHGSLSVFGAKCSSSTKNMTADELNKRIRRLWGHNRR